ncbi:MAG: family 20 glycosylhydrolase [Bacteroidales bacterium]|nr:family 20 glycosylhydrolase [Bacteroidales bacterium]
MRKYFLLFLVSLCFLGLATAQENRRYALIWHDEFNESVLDKNVWSKIWRGRADWMIHMSSDERLYALEKGDLVLRGMVNDFLPKDTAAFLTGGVWSRNRKAFGFGRVEVRSKFDVAQGFWPAIWMMPQVNQSIDWPYGGEIDIMEHFRDNPFVNNTVHSHYTVHLGKRNRPSHVAYPKYNQGEYNTYGMERFHDSLVFFVNGKRTLNYPRYRKGVDGQFPFDLQDYYLILDAQLGRDRSPYIDTTKLPVELRIDYVRYYELDTKTDVIPEPKEYQQYTRRKYKFKKVVVDSKETFDNPDEYRIVVKRGKATISGNVIWAQNTLNQLVDEQGKIANLEVHDWAEYPFRGFMHDTGRNYQTVSKLKETIDLMSFYKLNYFHWHLTDYPAWRIECKVYPQLNDARHQREGRDEGRYYTYDEIREVIAYAKERGITVVPEIDMPGHSTYFKNAFGFTMDSSEGRKVLERCLDEFFREIPKSDCPYIHIGSDEVWIEDPKGFMQWIENLVAGYGRQPIAWDPGLPASDHVIRQIWNEAAGSNAAASKKAGKYLDSFVGYLNYYDPMLFTSRCFLHTAAAQTTPDTTTAMGGILCLWNDVRVDDEDNISLHNGMINGMMAFSERFWNGGDAGEVENENLLPGPLTEAGSQLANFEEKMAIHRNRFYRHKMRWVANSLMEWKVQVDDNQPFLTCGGVVDLDMFCQVHRFNVGERASAVAQTVIIADEDTDVEAWIGFCTPARSNRNGYGIGEQGQWEGGCQCFVNGEEVLPQESWLEPGKYDYHFNTWGKPEEEEPFTDEQLYWMRQPVTIHLNQGENLVEMRVPKTYHGLRWSFAFMPVKLHTDGTVTEVSGIHYKNSADK